MVSKKLNYDEVMKLINVNIHNGTQAKIPGIFELIKDEDKNKFQLQLTDNIMHIIDEHVEMSTYDYQTIYFIQKLTRKLSIKIIENLRKQIKSLKISIDKENSIQSKLRKVI
ncbi:MAG: hypothetical protein ACYDEE_17135 [Ignavibacteriaceae bacterium]